MVKNLNTKSSKLLLFDSFEGLRTVRAVVLVAVRKRQFACKLSKKIRLHELSSGGDPVNFKFLNTLQSSRRVEIVFRFFPRYPLPRSKNCENCFLLLLRGQFACSPHVYFGFFENSLKGWDAANLDFFNSLRSGIQ